MSIDIKFVSRHIHTHTSEYSPSNINTKHISLAQVIFRLKRVSKLAVDDGTNISGVQSFFVIHSASVLFENAAVPLDACGYVKNVRRAYRFTYSVVWQNKLVVLSSVNDVET